MITALIVALAAEATVAAAPAIVEPDPKKMTRSEIRAFNATLPREHPYYIRCIRTTETGSLVKAVYSCRTNHQWDMADRKANDEAREIYDEMRSKASNTSGD